MKKMYKEFKSMPTDRKYLWIVGVGVAIVLLIGKIFGD